VLTLVVTLQGYTPKLHLFGSSANGFCLKDGDIDLCLTIEKRAGSRKSVVSQLTGILKKRTRLLPR